MLSGPVEVVACSGVSPRTGWIASAVGEGTMAVKLVHESLAFREAAS